MFDLTGGYNWSFAFAGIIGESNIAILLSFRFDREKRNPDLAAAN